MTSTKKSQTDSSHVSKQFIDAELVTQYEMFLTLDYMLNHTSELNYMWVLDIITPYTQKGTTNTPIIVDEYGFYLDVR